MDTRRLEVLETPAELMRGVHMLAIRRGLPVRVTIIQALYEALDRELADWPEWRYQTKPGDEKLFVDGRKAAGLKRRKKKPEPPLP